MRPYTDGFIKLLGQQRLPDLMRLVGRDDLGSYDHTGWLFRMAETSHGPRRGPPLLGQDNEYVYRELLGYSVQRYEELIASGEFGTRFSLPLLAVGSRLSRL